MWCSLVNMAALEAGEREFKSLHPDTEHWFLFQIMDIMYMARCTRLDPISKCSNLALTNFPWCDEHRKEYDAQRYQAKKDLRIRQSRAQRKRTKEWMDEIKAKIPCSDCGQSFPPVCMDWDHSPDSKKLDGIANMVAKGHRKQAEAEIKKCELVCSNCHRLRTSSRTG